MSLREKVKLIEDRPSERVTVPEWDHAEFVVRGLSAAQAESFSERIGTDGKKSPSVMAEMVIATAEDPETAELAFKGEDVEWLAHKSGAALRRLFEPAQRLSGMDSLEEAKKD